jgi:hypothetical protein
MPCKYEKSYPKYVITYGDKPELCSKIKHKSFMKQVYHFLHFLDNPIHRTK